MRASKKKICFIVIVIAILLITLLFICIHKDKPLSLREEAYNNIKNFTSLVIEKGSKKELQNASNIKDIEQFNIITGKDSYLRMTPKEKVIKTNGLEDYVQKNKEYADNLEKKIKENFDYSMQISINNKDKVVYTIEFISYYYSVYFFDLQQIQTELLKKSSMVSNEVNEYKAKIKAMEILNFKLDNYDNKDNNEAFTFNYSGFESEETQNSFYSYLLTLGGYVNGNEKIETLMKKQSERVTSYINEAIAKGVVDPGNVLAL